MFKIERPKKGPEKLSPKQAAARRQSERARGIGDPIAITQEWIEGEYGPIGAKTCPPLVKLAQRYKGEDGRTNWQGLSQEVRIVSHVGMKPGASLIDVVSQETVDFISGAVKGAAPRTTMFLFPDFPNNDAYEDFMRTLKERTVERLISSPENIAAVRSAFQLASASMSIEMNRQVESMGPEQLLLMARALTDGGPFNMVYFYKNPLSRETIAGFAETRGPKERQESLSAAPFYAAQMVNPFGNDDLVGNMDRPGLWERNTQKALKINLNELWQHIRTLRRR